MTTIEETCSCGATFRFVGSNYAAAESVARKWREQHKHAESVGICGDRPKVAGFPEHLPVPYCVLKAGHAGSHGDGEGSHWSERPRSAPESPAEPVLGASESEGRGARVPGAESEGER